MHRTSVHVADYFLDKLFCYTLTMGTRVERDISERYEFSAQLATIWGRGAYTIFQNHQEWDSQKLLYSKC
jgi:hypothetical protein